MNWLKRYKAMRALVADVAAIAPREHPVLWPPGTDEVAHHCPVCNASDLGRNGLTHSHDCVIGRARAMR